MKQFQVVMLTCVALALPAGCGPLEEGVPASLGEGITDGTVYTGHPSVGWLHIGGTTLCTATLVGSETVITAAHCIKSGQTHVFYAGGTSYSAASLHPYSGYDPSTKMHDIALIKLGSSPGITPSVLSESAPTVGMALTLIGYGTTGDGMNDAGVKRIATNTVAKVSTTRFSFTGTGGGIGNTCHGDSGGPAFATVGGVERLMGVTLGGTGGCGVEGVDTRTDAYSSWLQTTAGGDLAGSCSAVTLSGSPAAGSVSQGTTVALTAGATCTTGSNPEYAFRALLPSGQWTTVRPWGSGASFSWDTSSFALGAHELEVWVRAAGSATIQAVSSRLTYTITAPSGCSAVTLSGNPAAGSVSQGTSVALTASATCSAGSSPEYVFRALLPSGQWTTARPWGSSASFSWDTTSASTGAHELEVWVRAAGSGAVQAVSSRLSYSVAAGGASCGSATLSGSPAQGSVTAGTSVAFTAGSSCSSGSPEYVFRLLLPGGAWTTARPWGSGASFSWDTGSLAAGTYRVVVWVRAAGSGAPLQDASSELIYSVTAATACSAVTLSGSPASPVAAGASVSFSAAATCPGSVEYRFDTRTPSGVVKVAQAWSASASFSWDTTGAETGSHDVAVYVRGVGSSKNYEAADAVVYSVTAGQASCSGATLTAVPPPPSTVGTAVAFTASASCTAGAILEYRLAGYRPDGKLRGLTDWGASPSISWDTTGAQAGAYQLFVFVRIVGSGNFSDATSSLLAYTLN